MSVKKAKAQLHKKLNRLNPKSKHPDYNTGHGKPRSRREAIAQGFMAGAGYIMVPSIFSLASSALEGATTLADCVGVGGAAGVDVRMVRLDAKGGWTPLRAFPMGLNGSFQNALPSGADYASFGVFTQDPAAYIAGLNTTVLASGAPIDPNQPFWQGFMAVASPTTLANVGYEVVGNVNNDDSRNIDFGGMGHQIALEKAKGAVTDIISSRAPNGGTDGGAWNNVAPGQGGNFAVQVVNNPADIAGLVDPGRLLTYFNNDKAAAGKVLQGLQSTSSAKVQEMLMNDDLNTVQAKIAECGYLKAGDNLINKVVDPASDPAFIAVTTGPLQTPATQPLLDPNINFDNVRNNSNLDEHMARFWMSYSGNATYAVSEQDNHDNHGANGQAQFNRMLEIGMQCGAACEMAAQMGVRAMVGVGSDGSQSGDGNGDVLAGNNFVETDSDNETKGAYINIVYNPGGVLMDGFQVGSLNAGGSIDLASAITAANTGKVVEHVVNVMRILEGKEPKFELAGDKPNFTKLA